MRSQPNIKSKSNSSLQQGDLIYGFTEYRTIFLYKNANVMRFIQNTFSYSIDDYNNAIRSRSNNSILNFFISYFMQPYSEAFLKSTYDFDNFTARFENNSLRNPDYYIYHFHLDATDPFIIKRCKLGILWTLNKNNKIHFILDGINFAECFGKQIKKYTYSELRFVYRNWIGLKEFHKEGKLNFYRNINGEYKKVAAPWVEQPNISHGYKPKNSNLKLYLSFLQELRVKNMSSTNAVSSGSKCKGQGSRVKRHLTA